MSHISTDDNEKFEQVDEVNCGSTFTETEHYQYQQLLEDEGVLKSIEGEVGGPIHEHQTETIDSFRDQLASDVIVDGNNPYTMFTSPFERTRSRNGSMEDNVTKYYTVPLIYCDQTASNRPVKSIEWYIERICLPLYGNTHTNTSITGSQSTAFVAEARQIVAEETNAKITGKASLDIVMFAGNGATSAVELFIDCINLKHLCTTSNNQTTKPVVFIGPYEHHSNLIPWRESGCEIVMIPECSNSQCVDIDALERNLKDPKYSLCSMKIGTFTAASNVTGKLCDVNQIAAILHKYGALALFDYATASSYTKVDMNPPASDLYPSPSLIAKDAVFISPHKILGGIGTPGVLIVKKQLVSQINPPNRSGGGTVFYVTNTHHRFLSNRIHRFEGGTPNIVGIIRVGLTFLLKRQAEAKYQRIWSQLKSEQQLQTPVSILEYDFLTYQTVTKYLSKYAPNLVLLGCENNGCEARKKLPIFSFLIRFQNRFLHYNYVCAILNDVFGIQSRGGCQCAGPYSQKLLGLVTSTDDGDLPNAMNENIEAALYRWKERAELLRPGYTRISLPFKGSRTIDTEYVLKALVWVANNGWALMCQYRCNHRTGEWRHANRQGKPLGRDERKWLNHFVLCEVDDSLSAPNEGKFSLNRQSILDETLKNADKILEAAKFDHRSIVEVSKMTDAKSTLGNDSDGKLEELRWYAYPKECADLLLKGIEQPMINDEILLGALNPYPISVIVPTCKNSHDRKRKQQVANHAQVSDETEVSVCAPVVGFRDGDPIVDAQMEEIISDANDGLKKINSITCTPNCYESENMASKWHVDSDQTNLSASNTKGERKKLSRCRNDWGNRCDNQLNKVEPSIPIDTNSKMEIFSHKIPASSKKQKFRHMKPPPKLMRTATQAIVQWDMIKDGDRLLLGLSGGKDSLSLLHLLLEFQRVNPTRFDIEVCTIDPMTPSFDPSSLIPYVEALGLKYHYIRDDIVSRASTSGGTGQTVSSLCSFCARMKRGNLYSCARRNNCNKLVLAQHLDDCAESMMMSMMHNGFLRTMKANYSIDAGDLSVIRPLIYCREGLMTAFAKDANLPVINENCPACFEEPKERARIKKLLTREETLYPNFYDNIRRSLIPLMHDDMAPILRAYTETTLAKSRKIPFKRQKELMNISNDSDNSKTTETFKDLSLSSFSDDDLLLELTRRKVARVKMTRKPNATGAGESDIHDGTGQVCSFTGGNGSIPCVELME